MTTVRGCGANRDVSPQMSSITYFLGEFGLVFLGNIGDDGKAGATGLVLTERTTRKCKRCTSLSFCSSSKGRAKAPPLLLSSPLPPQKRSAGKWGGETQYHVLCGPWLALSSAEGEPEEALLDDVSCS